MARTSTHRGVSIRVEGLKEVRRDLKEAGDFEGSAALKAALAEAADHVVATARSRASTRQERSMASRLKASRSAASSAVTLGGKPYDLGTEFGAKRWPQFRDWRGNDLGAGYLLFPTIRDQEERILEPVAGALQKVLAGKGAASLGAASGVMAQLEAAIGG